MFRGALAQGNRGTIERRGIRPAERRRYFGVSAGSQEPVAVLRFALRGLRRVADMSNRRAVLDRSSEPASLYRVMQAMIGEGLREHYEVPQKMSHELFVLLMQMNERNTGAARRRGKNGYSQQTPERGLAPGYGKFSAREKDKTLRHISSCAVDPGTSRISRRRTPQGLDLATAPVRFRLILPPLLR